MDKCQTGLDMSPRRAARHNSLSRPRPRRPASAHTCATAGTGSGVKNPCLNQTAASPLPPLTESENRKFQILVILSRKIGVRLARKK